MYNNDSFLRTQFSLRLATPLLRLRNVRSKLPSRHSLHKHLIKFLIRSPSGLRLVPPKERDAREAKRAKDETELPTKIRFVWIEEIG